MPRIDPLDLLNCLGVLLSTNGGIKGPGEVVRVARLMLRFSKKLVSKCIYIHVLKATPHELLDQFLNEQGAYFLLLKWLVEALHTRNTPLLTEMLELVQLLPMSEVRLKDEEVTRLIRSTFPYNDLSQMMQSIAEEYNDQNCRNLAAQFWARWCAASSKPEEFTLTQESILPDDMDLSIYAPDTTSTSYGDQLGMNIGEGVDMAMGNLSSLDMNTCTPYMENNDYYNLNHFEPVAMNNNMSHDNHQVYMDGTASYTNEPLQQQLQPQQQLQQHQVLIPGPLEVNNQLLSTPTTAVWPSNSNVPIVPTIQTQPAIDETVKPNEIVSTGLPVLKIKVSKAGTYVVNSTNNPAELKEETKPSPAVGDQNTDTKEKDKTKEKDRIKERRREKDKKTSSSSSSSKTKEGDSKSSDSKKRDKDRERDRSKSSSTRDSKSSSSNGRDRSKSIKDDRKEKPKIKASPRSESQIKEAKQAEKNRETLAAIKAMSPVVKLAKIPRKKVEDIVAPPTETSTTSATELLDKLAPRPKTVKTFNSKFRSTGLVEEPGKSPPVGIRKPGAASPSSAADKKSPNIKRSGSIDGLIPPADKKMKAVDDTAISAAVAAVMKKTASDIKPAVKLISPRPRPLLQDSSLFMDALEAGSKSTTEPRKRKRSAKDGSTPDLPPPPSINIKQELPETPPAPAAPANRETSPTPMKPMFNFYQDTLETDGGIKQEEKPDTATADAKEIKEECPESPSAEKEVRVKMEVDGEENEEANSRDSIKTDMAGEESPPSQSDSGKPKGVLILHAHQKRRPKKNLQWRPEEELEMHHYFELDETERVNVNKLLFGEMKQAEKEREKQSILMSKTMIEEPEIEENPWKGLQRIDNLEDRVIYGENSKEKEIQAARESSTLQALYFKGQVLPDAPIEADPEVPLERTDKAPTIIPLDDVTGNPESVYDHRHLPWPEPKTMRPQHPMAPYGGGPHHVQQPPYQQQHQPPQQQPYGGPGYRSGPPTGPGPIDQYYPDHGPPMHDDHYGHGGLGDIPLHDGHGDIPHHGGPPMHHHHPGGRGGHRGDVGGTWMAGDGSIYPDHDVGQRYNDGPPHRDGPPHHRDGFHHHREREHVHPRDRGGHGYNDMMGGPNPGFMGHPEEWVWMDRDPDSMDHQEVAVEAGKEGHLHLVAAHPTSRVGTSCEDFAV
ncbi:hypothetical protein GHT06_008289 [Daphnia sinensis]|uniref:Serine/threonine-protein phosphatase 1 regulatory subunit n=1 Tax=Daphnia sinensis TaxID=1820382 RepID=A0AAD5LKS6_9CRUS|nr:hypothetical protein GHT06_008289 [Daphnia sinensis]